MFHRARSFCGMFALVMSAVLIQSAPASPRAAGAITYQGQLDEAGLPAVGPVDLRFTLHDLSTGGVQIGVLVEHLSVALNVGRFTVDLDFGPDVFLASNRWIEIQVALPGSGLWTTLTPRQQVMPAPVALFALDGNQGPAGAPGADGLDGADGATGSAGPQGTQGPDGPQGVQGIQGDQGVQGIQGPDGPQGLQGNPGQDGSDALWQVSGFSMYYNGGNIGIGTSGPEERLQIIGGSEVSGAAGGFIQIGKSAVGNMGIDQNEIQARLNGVPTLLGLNNHGGDLTLGNPASTVVVPGTIRAGGSSANIGSHPNLGDTFAAFWMDGQDYALRASNTGTYLNADIGSRLYFRIANSTRMVVDGITGNIGIGDDSPAEGRLTIRNDDVSEPTLYLENYHAGPGLVVETGINASSDIIRASNNNDLRFVVEGLGNVRIDGSFFGGGADFAEWLQHVNPKESFKAGDVVGVFGGKISKRTADATQIMVISTNPVVLGNNVDAETSSRSGFEKVAFIGQTPVRVRGLVYSGDYIIASGNNDGTAIAISPMDIETNQLTQIIGIAWEEQLVDSSNAVHSLNVSIGVGELAVTSEITSRLKEENDELRARLAKLEATVASLVLQQRNAK